MAVVEHLTADTFGTHVGKYQGRLKITKGSEVLAQAPLLHLPSVTIASTGVSISADAVRSCCEHGIPVHFVGSRGRVYASLYSAALTGTALTRRAQLELRLTGIVDEVVQVAAPEAELIPVDYKLARQAGYHFKLHLAAHAMLLEETYHLPVRRGFLSLIPLRRAEEVPISAGLRRKVAALLEQMQLIAQTERMPPPNEWPPRCANCEFRRFCNHV